MTTPVFPTLPEARMRQLLEPPTGPLRLIIDTDTYNEIDDQFALAWALLSRDVFEIEGVLAAPFSFAHHRAALLAAHEELQRDGQAVGPEVAIVGSYHRWAQNLQAAGTDPYSLRFVGPDEGMELDAALEEVERNLIGQALTRTNGVRTQAAALLGISERALRYKRAKYKEDIR